MFTTTCQNKIYKDKKLNSLVFEVLVYDWSGRNIVNTYWQLLDVRYS